ncbi:hypothetical protein DITRI_Ditri11bG0032600 [Diplodiscus trichospermus]
MNYVKAREEFRFIHGSGISHLRAPRANASSFNLGKGSVCHCLDQLLYLCIFPAGEAVSPYIPIENIAIDCGSSSDTLALYGHRWTGESDSIFPVIHSESNSTFPVIHSQSKLSIFLSASTGHVPYITSRLSYSQFTYMIPVRLHFLETSVLCFMLKARILVKEFCVRVEHGKNLNVTFTPSSAITGAYAFVSGIEIVSMPTGLYYSAAKDLGLTFLGRPSLYHLGNDTTLEMIHRISVGGAQISAAGDTGMYRAWSDDIDYLTVAKPSAIPENISANITFGINIPSFTAPRSIYLTARSMGANKTMN